MEISVIICTRNRASQLSELLTSMCGLAHPGVDWECIVVDNGSTDNTAEVVESFEGLLPIRRVMEPAAGVSNARNAGVIAAKGRYIVWTDDDVLVEPNWLAGYGRAFRRWPDAAVFGGKITPLLRPPTPDWFQRGTKYLTDVLGARNLGDKPIHLSMIDYQIPYGANYAVRAAEQQQHRYDPSLGVAPGRRLGGEEVDVIKRILESGKEGRWVPDVGVQHIVPPSHQTVAYIARYYEAVGEYEVYSAIRSGGVGYGPISLLILAATVPASFIGYHLARALGLGTWARFLRRYARNRGVLKTWLHSFLVTGFRESRKGL